VLTSLEVPVFLVLFLGEELGHVACVLKEGRLAKRKLILQARQLNNLDEEVHHEVGDHCDAQVHDLQENA
jgi:hypothetical protein